MPRAKSVFPKGGSLEGYTVAPSIAETQRGETDGGINIERYIPKFMRETPTYKMLRKVTRVITPGYETIPKEQEAERPSTPPPAPTGGATPAGFSRRDYRDADITDPSEFGYRSLKCEVERRGYKVVEMPDIRMKSLFGNIGYERDGDIYIAMSKACTAEGVEILAHELKAKELQRMTGNYNHEDFHPVIEPLQGRAARDIMTGRDARRTMSDYIGQALRAVRLAA